jgi:L-alanine-DL-glutamate epimerase-like enolase superfamily enzyme
MNLRYWKFELPFVYPFGISSGTKTHQPTLIVELEHLGVKGYGEAPAIHYYDVSVESMIAKIESKKNMITRYAFNTPERYWHYLHHIFPNDPFIVCALDMAGWDLYGKMRRMSLQAMWKAEDKDAPLTDYTIGLAPVEEMVEKMKAKPWPIYKIKLGGEEDVAIVRELRKHTTAVFRVDANAGWTVESAMRMIPVLKETGVELIEQPLAKDDVEGMQKLFEVSDIPLIADESCVGEGDVEKCVGLFHGINIKLTKCGGITPALRMIENARRVGLKLMIGSMNESTIGTAAIAQLMPYFDYVDADGPLLLAEDVASGLGFSSGVVSFSGNPGLGIAFEKAL